MKCIITKAYTGSEWDNVSFAVIELSKGHVDNILSLQNEAKRIYKGQCGYIVIFADMAEFFVDDFDDMEETSVYDKVPKSLQKTIKRLEENKPAIVDVEDGAFNSVSRPENNIKYGEYRVTPTTVQYSANGKHTGEEFWTPEIPINLIKTVKLCEE